MQQRKQFGKSEMKTIILLFFCLFLFFSCSDLDVENGDGDSNRRDRRERDRKDRDEEKDEEEYGGEKSVCEGLDYTLYLTECPEKNDESRADEGESGLTADGEPSDSEASSLPEPKKPMDILFVLDTSEGMEPYLNKLFSDRFRTFLTIINRLNWRIMFTNAGYSSGDGWFDWIGTTALNGKAMELENKDGRMKAKYLEPRMPDYSNTFQYTLTREPKHRGSVGTGYRCYYAPYCDEGEQPLRALQMSFSANKQFVRKEADFVAIIITNEDEEPEEDEPNVTAGTIFQEFKKVYGSGKKLYILNIIVLPGDEHCVEENIKIQSWLWEQSTPGEKISEVAKKIGGGNFNICLEDYSVVADTIVRLSAQ